MDFLYTDEQLELRERAAALARDIMAYEDECEANRGLSAQSLAEIRELTLKAGLNAINMPVQWGGQGLSILDPVEGLYRDIRVDRIWEGTSEIQRMIIAGEARKRGLDGMLRLGAAVPDRESVHA